MLFSVEIFGSKDSETILVVPDNLSINVRHPVVLVKKGAYELIKAYMLLHPEVKATLFNKDTAGNIEFFLNNIHDKTVDYICGKIDNFTKLEVGNALYLWSNLQIGLFSEPTLS